MTGEGSEMASEDALPCHELVALGPVTSVSFGDDWPVAPGAVLRSMGGRPEALHFAPGRWLLPSVSAALAARCRGFVTAGLAALVDVEGKWRMFALRGPGAKRSLAAGVPVELILRQRACAALTLFDCPVVLSRRDAAFEVWAHASYSMHLRAALAGGVEGSDADGAEIAPSHAPVATGILNSFGNIGGGMPTIRKEQRFEVKDRYNQEK